ncbi:T9SS type A sorting domain-containing protein [Hymenobacter arizonensis]|uniref:T9SS type A sorting domain-containing protein n=1 Tax=Hymenobacter arizonensis TaxID=1227077 RepID=UPI0015A66308|nr:T9SS type A sorting domain-containing protein [Hymenobacter arizonensis]
MTNVGGTLQEYTDTTALVGGAYEYRVSKYSSHGSAEGFMLAGINVAAQERRGTLVLLVDNTHAAYLAPDLEQLQADLVGDGWLVVRHDVAPTLTPPQVRALIQADYQADPLQVQAVFILGHVAVPYSGALNPDAHSDHYGAWPADVYYGDMTSTWTDAHVNTVSASRPENRNVPGDGKFDHSILPRAPQLMVGRVDLSRLPAFALPERELLRRYLRKDHQFRHKQWNVAQRGLVDDQFGLSTGEDFANNGWRNFAPMFGIGPNDVVAAHYFSSTRTDSYLWSYACGPSGYTSMGGVGSTADFASGPVQSVFNMLFGSYFGDWDNPDNFMRAALAAEGYTLASCWAGRPDWAFHFMGLGETLGYCTRRSQPTNDFASGFGQNGIHTALMGDPTLRLHPLAPAGNLTASAASGAAMLSWTGSADASEGYYVYRARTPAGPFFRISAQAVASGTTTFTDPAPLNGMSCYMVRAVKLLTTPSGSYYNLSQGTTATFSPPTPPASGGTWLGTLSTNWNTPGNWSSGVVPMATATVIVPAGTPFAPTLSGKAAVEQLTLAPQARLTIAAGGSLRVSLQPVVQPAPAAAPATALVLAAGTATVPGGRLTVLDHSSALNAGLLLDAGTALTVGNGAELHLLGSLRAGAATLSFAGRGGLVFDRDSTVYPPLGRHIITGASAVAVGILRLSDSRETLALNCPVQILSQIENYGLIQTNAQLTLRSTLGQQAILTPVVPGPGRVRTLGRYTGNVTVQVYVDGSRNPGLGYRHLTPPVTGSLATIGRMATSTFTPVVNINYNTIGPSVTPFPTVFTYAQESVGRVPWAAPGFDNGWRSPFALTNFARPGRGLTVNMLGNNTLSFTGVAQNGPLIIHSFDRDSTESSGWQFLGNPYAAPLDWDVLAADTTNFVGVNPALYVFTSSGQYTGTYASYLPGTDGNPGISINGGGPIVPVGQGFFVRAREPDNPGSIGFSLDQLLTSPMAPTVQRAQPDTRPRLTLALRDASGSQAHETAIYFQAGATAGPDAAYDATALPSGGQLLSLTSSGAGSTYGINGLPALTGADVVVPLRLRAAAAGTYQLRTETLADLPAGYHAYLHDTATGRYTDLAAAPVTTIVLAANTLVSRYAVNFTRQGVVLATAPAALSELVSLYPNPAHDRATLLLPPALRSAATGGIKVMNALGQMLPASRCTPSSEGFEIELAGLAPGIYIVQIPTAAGPLSRRLVVK